jgi:2-C-methyl-D-erythritol 4-phosphate cytidylyltransferase
MEWAGARPRLVPGSARNIKVTWPEDLEIAAFCLASMGKQGD